MSDILTTSRGYTLVDTTRGFYNGEHAELYTRWYGYEQESYDSNGFKKWEIKYLDDSCYLRLEKSWYKNGNPRMEIYVDYKVSYAYEKYYNEEGILVEKDEFPSELGDSSYTINYYYKNGQIEYTAYLKNLNLNIDYQSLEFIDSTSQIIWFEIPYKRSRLRGSPISMTEYYENGKIKGNGLLLQRDVLAHTMEKKLIYPWQFCKNGKWIYYNEDGTIKEVINYKNCMPE